MRDTQFPEAPAYSVTAVPRVLLARLADAGIRLWVDGGSLKFRAPDGALTPELRAQIKDHREAFVALLGNAGHASISATAEAHHYPVSHAQRRLWVLSQFEDCKSAYNLPMHMRLHGPMRRPALQRALARIVERHEALRTTFRLFDDEPRQIIANPLSFAVQFTDLRDEAYPEEALDRLARGERQINFDLANGPLFRARLVRVAEEEHALLLTMHHIVADGRSLSVLLRELSALYRAFSADQPDPLPPVPIQYRDYAYWQNQQLVGGHLDEQREFWRQELAEEIPRLDLTLVQRPARQTFAGDMVILSIGEYQTEAVKALARRHGASLFMTLVAVVQTLLFRYSDKKLVAVGTPVAGRTHADLQDGIGIYLNTIVLANRPAAALPFGAFVDQVRDQALRAFARQDYPFDKLVDDLNTERDLSRNPVFDVMVLLQNAGSLELSLPQITLSPLFEEPGTSKFDLAFDFEQHAGQLLLGIRFNTALFSRSRIEALGSHFQTLLEGVLQSPDCPIGKLPLLPDEARRTLLAVAGPTRGIARELTVVDLIAAQVEATPLATAVLCEEQSLTYAEVWQRSESLAAQLLAAGVGREEPVAFALPRGTFLPVAILGILRAGATFVPLDPRHPASRIDSILADSGTRHLVTDDATLDALGSLPDRIQVHRIGQPRRAARDVTAPARGMATPEGLAYIIYTSGTTGRPKGVSIKHDSLANFLASMRQRPGCSPGDVLLSVTTAAFDIFYLELFLPLCCGARIVLATEDQASDGHQLARIIDRHGVTIMQATPSTWQLLVHADWRPYAPITMLCGGEPLPKRLARSLLATGGRLWNMYGPTETTIWSTLAPVTAADDITIGRPIAETRVYVLDEQYNPVPAGITGELFIGGAGLARGYWRRPDLDAEKFIANPFVPGGRLYRTGDHAQWLDDGRLLCLGRRDGQVKIRGFRIETADVEHHLAQLPGVRNAVVLARMVGNDEVLSLVAYISGECAPDRLRRALAERLPAYMIPDHFVPVDVFPMGPTGKLLVRELPDPAANASPAPDGAPQTLLEEQLCGHFSTILGCAISATGDFFAHGGHSLKAMALSARLTRTYGKNVSLADLFSSPSPRTLAAVLGEKDAVPYAPIPGAPAAEDYPLSDAQRRLWIAAQDSDSSVAYNQPAAILLSGALNVDALQAAVRFLVDRHESLRTTFTQLHGEPRQIIGATGISVMARVDSRRQPDPLEHAKRWLADDNACAFDLEQGPLFRAALLQLGDTSHVLALNMHHIVSDAWSMRVVARELAAAYNAFDQDIPVRLSPLRIQYRDYAAWQTGRERDASLVADRDYWTRKLAQLPPAEILPPDRPRHRKPRHLGALARRLLEPPIVAQLHALGRQQAGDLFATLAAAIRTLLFRYSGQEDAAIACVTAGRAHPDIHDQVGFYVNTLLLRDRLDSGATFREVLDQVTTCVNAALDHAEYPFDRLGADLGVNGPLYQVMLDYHVDRDRPPDMRGLSVTPFGARPAVSKFDLLFLFAEDDQGLHVTLEYDSDLFLPARMETAADHLLEVLRAVASEPDRSISELPPGGGEASLAVVATRSDELETFRI